LNDNPENHGQMIRVGDGAGAPEYYQPSAHQFLYEPEEDNKIHLLDYWRVVVKRRWTIFTLILAVLIVTAVATWNATPMYRATIKLQIDPEQTNVLPFKEAMEQPGMYAFSQEYLQTQIRVLASKTLADRVINVLNLEENPYFKPEPPAAMSKTLVWVRGMLVWVRDLFRGDEENARRAGLKADSLERKYSPSTRAFISSLTVTPIRTSRIVDVSFDSRNPRLASDVLNTLAAEYIQFNFETKFNATNVASAFLAKQLVDLQAKVEKSEEALVDFSRRHDIYSIGEKDNVILQKLSDLNTALTAAQADRIQKESTWTVVKQLGPGSFPDLLRSSLIKDLETNVANLRVQHAKLSALFKPGWHELDQVIEQLAEAEKQLSSERQKLIRNVETDYRTSLEREKLLTQALAAQKLEASALNQNSIQYNIHKREVETNKELYDGLLQRMKEAGVSAGLKSNNIHVVDPAEPPRFAFRPQKALSMGLALIVGLILGVGLAFFLEYLDSSVKTPEDIDRFIKLPSLGVIPSLSLMVPAPERKRLSAVALGGNGASKHSRDVELITYNDAKSLISEAYRNLRTSVLLSSGAGRPPKSILVTSSQMGEGKTTTALNIAITLAQTGNKVILLDCDMRNPRIHKALSLENTEGMSSFLSGNSDLSSLIRQSEIPNLFAVTAGRIPPNPAELVGSQRMRQGLTLLEDYFEHIVIDTPPVLSVTDPRILASMADGVILVIKGGETPKEAVQRSKRLLQDVHAHIIGTLLNDVNVHSADYYYYSKYYYYGYGKKYGYGYGVKSQQEKVDNA
jgi:capsular exopolysaccharide synthesis family protein